MEESQRRAKSKRTFNEQVIVIIIQAMRLMSELCLYYNIEDVTLWTKLLDQFLELNMVNECSYKGGESLVYLLHRFHT